MLLFSRGEIYSRLGLLNCIIFARQGTGKKELVHRGITEVYVGHFPNSLLKYKGYFFLQMDEKSPSPHKTKTAKDCFGLMVLVQR